MELLAAVPVDPHPLIVSTGASLIVATLALVIIAAFAEAVWSIVRREPPRR